EPSAEDCARGTGISGLATRGGGQAVRGECRERMAGLGPQPELLESMRRGARGLGHVGKKLLEEITAVNIAAQAVAEPDRGSPHDELLVSIAQARIAHDAHIERMPGSLDGALRDEELER